MRRQSKKFVRLQRNGGTLDKMARIGGKGRKSRWLTFVNIDIYGGDWVTASIFFAKENVNKMLNLFKLYRVYDYNDKLNVFFFLRGLEKF